MTTLTTEELLKRATPLKDWKFEKCPCGSPVCNKFLLNIARSSRMFDPEHAELVRRMAASWDALREFASLFDAYDKDCRSGKITWGDLRRSCHRALALSNGEEGK